MRKIFAINVFCDLWQEKAWILGGFSNPLHYITDSV
jgi:hypothetical protein